MKRFLAIVVAVVLGPTAAYAMIPPPPSSDHGVERGGILRAALLPQSVRQFALKTLAKECPTSAHYMEAKAPEARVADVYNDGYNQITIYDVAFYLVTPWTRPVTVTMRIRYQEATDWNAAATSQLVSVSATEPICKVNN